MTRLLMLLGVAAVAGAMYVATASGSQQSAGVTAKQFKALKQQVATLKATVKVLKNAVIADTGVLVACDAHAVPINQFGDAENGAYGYHYLQPDGTTEIVTSALDISSASDTGAGWFAYGSSSCNTALGGLRRNAARAGLRLPRTSSHPTLNAHRR